MTTAVLRFDNVSRTFGALRAVDGVTLRVDEGEILGIMGPNGSGKTTLLNLASGFYQPDCGEIFFKGRDIRNRSLHGIVRLGLVRSFQHPRIFSRLDSLQHTVAALREATTGIRAGNILSRLKAPWTRWTDEARAKLKIVFGDRIPTGSASTLSYGQRRLLELVRCFATGPSLLLLDEPTSGLNDEESALLSTLLLKIVREHGLTAVVVDHKFGFLSELCGRIVVMDQGRCIADQLPEEIARNPRVNEIYFGGSLI